MNSETITAHGVAPGRRQGRSRACSSYHSQDRGVQVAHRGSGMPIAARANRTVAPALHPGSARRALTTVARMGSVRHPRGRLPRRVYWVRRSVVLGVALASSSGSAGSSAAPARTTADSDDRGQHRARPSSRTPARVGRRSGRWRPSKKTRGKTNAPSRCCRPSGECRDDDVSVLPIGAAGLGRRADRDPAAAAPGLQPACTFEVSPESLVGEDHLAATTGSGPARTARTRSRSRDVVRPQRAADRGRR